MSGTRRIAVGNLSQGKLRGKALSDALYRDLNSQNKDDAIIKKKITKQSHGKKK